MTLSKSRNSLHFVEPECLLPCSLKPIYHLSIPNQTYPVHAFPACFFKILFSNFSHPCPGLPSGLPLSCSPSTALYASPFSSIPLIPDTHLHVTKYKNNTFYSPLNDLTDLCFPLSNSILFIS